MKKRAFTLIELLVVTAVVAVLMALLLPAVQHAREDARSKQCTNNLKQLGLAMHNYHDAMITFPPGWVAKSGAPGDGPRFGWMTMLLPYLDHAPLYNFVDFSSPLPPSDEAVAANRFGGRPPVPKPYQLKLDVYRCPSDVTPATNALRGDYATANYTGVFGSDPLPRLMPLGLADFWPGSVEAPMSSNGTFARNSRVGIRSFTDGLSNTMIVSEKCFTSGAGIWPGVTDNAHEDDALTAGDHASRPNAGLGSFSSRHEKGIYVLIGDGSVRFVSESIDSKPGGEDLGMFQRLANIKDGQRVEF